MAYLGQGQSELRIVVWLHMPLNSAWVWNKDLPARWHEEHSPQGVRYRAQVDGHGIKRTSPSLTFPGVPADAAAEWFFPLRVWKFLFLLVAGGLGVKKKNNKYPRWEYGQAKPLCQSIYPEEWRVMIEQSDN